MLKLYAMFNSSVLTVAIALDWAVDTQTTLQPKSEVFPQIIEVKQRDNWEVREHSWNLAIRSIAKQIQPGNAMNAHTILAKTISLVSSNMHKTRQKTLIACVKSLTSGSAASVTSMGRGIRSHAFEKHRIKRADRLLSNANLRRETPNLYAAICGLLCHSKHPVIAVDWSDLDDHKGQFCCVPPWQWKADRSPCIKKSTVIKPRHTPTLFDDISHYATIGLSADYCHGCRIQVTLVPASQGAGLALCLARTQASFLLTE